MLDFINEEDFHLGIPFEFQLNQVTLINNEIYMDGVNQAHNVNHVPANLTNTTGNNNPSGFGFGGGSGLHTYVGYGRKHYDIIWLSRLFCSIKFLCKPQSMGITTLPLRE